MAKLAFSHPGKLGDALYALPTIRHITNHYGCTADFYTSEYCRPMKRLMEYQSCVDGVFIPDNYRIERMDIGVQPWYIPIDGSLYDIVWQLGYRQVPDRALPAFIAIIAGIGAAEAVDVKYDYPEFQTLDEPYICIAPRGKTTFEPLFLEVIEKSPVKVVQIGGYGDAVGDVTNEKVVDLSGLDMLETLTWLSKCRGFVGIMSAMLVLANGFDMPKFSPHDGKSWDMRHVVNGPTNFYPVHPTADQILGEMGL